MNGFIDFLKANKRMIIGVCAGLVVGILILTIGFFPTLLLGICAGIGALCASTGGFKQSVIRAIDKILPKIFK